MKDEFKLCKDCINMKNTKPPRCKSSRMIDLIDGNEDRPCFLERIDGVGRCGGMGNNFQPK